MTMQVIPTAAEDNRMMSLFTAAVRHWFITTVMRSDCSVHKSSFGVRLNGEQHQAHKFFDLPVLKNKIILVTVEILDVPVATNQKVRP